MSILALNIYSLTSHFGQLGFMQLYFNWRGSPEAMLKYTLNVLWFIKIKINKIDKEDIISG